jgi:hypothetical protein
VTSYLKSVSIRGISVQITRREIGTVGGVGIVCNFPNPSAVSSQVHLIVWGSVFFCLDFLRYAICSRCQREASCHLLPTNSWHFFLRWYTNPAATGDRCCKASGGYMKISRVILLPRCHAYIEVWIKFSASECCYLIFETFYFPLESRFCTRKKPHSNTQGEK